MSLLARSHSVSVLIVLVVALTGGCADISEPAAPTPTSSLPRPEPLVGPEGTSVPTGFVPTAVSFRSAAGGYLVGTFRCAAQRRCPALLRTRDAGLTWRALPAPTTAFRAVRFATQRDGWAFGPQLSATHDGGATWVPVPGATAVRAVEVMPSIVWRLDRGRLLQSPVARDAWADERRTGAGLAVSRDRLYLLRAGDAVQLRTPDGGWTSLRPPCNGAFAASEDTRAALVCSSAGGLRLVTTIDATARWTVPRTVPGGSDPLVRVAAQGNTVFVGAGSRLLVTTNAGLGWTEALVGRVRDLATGGDATVAVIIGVRLYLSHDAGSTWSVVSF